MNNPLPSCGADCVSVAMLCSGGGRLSGSIVEVLYIHAVLCLRALFPLFEEAW